MFLKKLKLENVRCFKSLELDFCCELDESSEPTSEELRKWTILLGGNGTGKSTVLRAAALVTCGSSALADVFGGADEWIRFGEDSCTISAVIQNQKGEERNISITVGRKDSVHEVITNANKSLEELDNALDHSNRNYFVSGYGASRRLSSGKGINSRGSHYRSSRANSIASLFDREALLNPLESWAMELDYESNGAAMKTVTSVLDSFLPDLKFKKIDKKNKKLLFNTPDGVVPLSQLSDGYQNVAAWAGDLLYRINFVFEDYSKPLETRGLLIIDEIDLHLHPQWQRSIIGFLQNNLPNMQFLITTHSAVTAQQANAGELQYLIRNKKNIDLHKFNSDPSGLLVNQLLISEVFGLNSDESLKLTEQKHRYRELRKSAARSFVEQDEFDELKTQITTKLSARTENVTPKDSQLERLKLIQQIIWDKE